MKRLACLVILAGCGSDPADVTGHYTVNVTDEANGCNLSNFTQGQSSTNIPVDVTQDGGDVTLTLTGAVGDYVNLVLGSNVFSGTVDGSHVAATLFGTRSQTMNGCAFTYNAELDGDLAGDTMTGSISYTPKTNGSPDCASIEGCTSTQNFNGTRPPK